MLRPLFSAISRGRLSCGPTYFSSIQRIPESQLPSVIVVCVGWMSLWRPTKFHRK